MVQKYKAHFHKTVEYDGLGCIGGGVVYQEIFERLEATNPKVDLAAMKEEFLHELFATHVKEDEFIDDAT